MGSLVGSGNKPVWMKETRKLTASGHQTSLISTAYHIPHTLLAARMFSRWCQENFFRYMMQHFAIDLLEEYGTTIFPDTEQVVNPKWRELNRTRNSLQNKLRSQKATFGHITINPQDEPDNKKNTIWEKKKAELLEDIEQLEHTLTQTKNDLKNTAKHIPWSELEEKDKFQRLIPNRKRLMDTVRMVAYRAETALAIQLKEQGIHLYDARRLLQNLFMSEADILPDQSNKILNIQIHNTSRANDNNRIEKILKYLNEIDMEYPGTELKMRYDLRGEKG